MDVSTTEKIIPELNRQWQLRNRSRTDALHENKKTDAFLDTALINIYRPQHREFSILKQSITS